MAGIPLSRRRIEALLLNTLRLAVLVAATAPLASAATYVVDDSGGPGVDFTTIAAAIAVAVPGDVILVRPGWYSGFTLSSGVSARADGAGVTLAGAGTQLSGIPADQRAVVSGFELFDSSPLVATNCAGRVLIERVRGSSPTATARVQVSNCVDLRIAVSTGIHVETANSRVEIANSSLRGRRGADGCMPGEGCEVGPGYPGGNALMASAGSVVHLGATSVRGGEGGDGGHYSFCPGFPGGAGGHGMVVTASSVLVTGTGAEYVDGGAGGLGYGGFCAPGGYGPPGSAAVVQGGGTILYSNVLGGLSPSASTVQVSPADPCLAVSGTGVAGTTMTFTLHGEPGDEARLRLGRQMVVEDIPFVFEDRLVTPLRSYLLGVVPPSGTLTFAFHVPTGLPEGFVVIAQASTTSPAGETRLTQSAPFAVR